ncbi:ATP-binding protein [Bordetella genomosp. 9]|uniref:Sensory/regulatory protein RpfC n=1 Tax=Bordetella genomosp. 9 TaxID=1416803 RepID=A0A1W6Z176_9BORD|nr:ATP-binding protein [Bordetella genomosp. 9]ARP87105.1 hypothetical protein CAL13_13470 [Bordetella genomosp. 9]
MAFAPDILTGNASLLLAALGFALTLIAVCTLLWTQRRMRIVRHTAEKARAEAILARERAEAADSAKSAFLATVSHEIRTPMNGVIGVLDILQETPLSAEQRHYLGTAMQSARLLLRVINDILDYAKIESGALQLCNAPYDFYLAMDNMAELYLPLARRKGLVLTVAVMPHFDRRLIGDEIRISQVVANLVSNAIAFTDRGAVTLSARRRLNAYRDEVEIDVIDTGAGMSEEYQRRLFSPFQQEDTSTTRRHGGTGLGLSIVKHLVDRMGGHIDIRSRRGEGTRARVRLPARWHQPACVWPRHTGRTATVHTDNPVLRPMLLAWCRKAGLRVVPPSQPSDIRLITDAGDGFWVMTAVARHGPVHSVYGFLRTLEALWAPSPGTPRPALPRDPTTQLQLGEDGSRAQAKASDPPPEGAAQDVAIASAAGRETRPPAAGMAIGADEVLVVEDNEINRDITLRQLALLSVHAHAAEDGEAGYSAWLDRRPRVMLVDCHMPRLDGYELARRIRTQEMINGWPRTILIGFSANATQSDARACLAAGMDDYVSKPTTRSKLLQALRRTGFLPVPEGPMPDA